MRIFSHFTEEEIPFKVKLEWKKDPLSSRAEIPKFAILSHFDLDKIPIHVEKKNAFTLEDKKRSWSNLEGLDPPLSVKKLKPLGYVFDSHIYIYMFIHVHL